MEHDFVPLEVGVNAVQARRVVCLQDVEVRPNDEYENIMNDED